MSNATASVRLAHRFLLTSVLPFDSFIFANLPAATIDVTVQAALAHPAGPAVTIACSSSAHVAPITRLREDSNDLSAAVRELTAALTGSHAA